MAAPLNVLWICADDFAPYMSSVYGDPRVPTPSLEHLASGGMRFDRAFCTCPLSTPSNQSSWTGRFPRSIGVTLSPTSLPEDEVARSLPVRFRRAGYQTAAVGKTHYYAPHRELFDIYAEQQEHADWLDEHGRVPVPNDVPVLGEWSPFRQPAWMWLNANALPFDAYDRDMQSTFYARQAAGFLRERRDGRPFLLHVGLCETHSPFRFPIEFYGRQDRAAFEAAEVEHGADVPEVFANLSADDACGIQAAYATAVEYLDRNVGIVLDALHAEGLADNTLVVFTSDHGYLLGQHGRFEKHCCYEEAIRVALIAQLPGVIPAATSTDALVQLVDVLPTILDLCGIPSHDEFQGRSLAPLLRGEATRHRDDIVVEYADNAEGAVRTERHKLIYSAGTRTRWDGYAAAAGPRRWCRLFDLEADPHERVDLSEDPEHAHVRVALLARLVEHMTATVRDPGLQPSSADPHEALATLLLPAEGGDVPWD